MAALSSEVGGVCVRGGGGGGGHTCVRTIGRGSGGGGWHCRRSSPNPHKLVLGSRQSESESDTSTTSHLRDEGRENRAGRADRTAAATSALDVMTAQPLPTPSSPVRA